MRIPLLMSVIVGMLLLMIGCNHDSRLGDLAERVTHDQAEQNQRIAESAKSIAQGSQQLVEADANSRRELIEMQNSLRADQAELAKQRDALEVARAEIAADRLTDSQLANGIVAVGVLIAAVAPLVLAGLALIGLWREPTREEEGHVLIEELSRAFIVDQAPTVPRIDQMDPHRVGDQSTDESMFRT